MKANFSVFKFSVGTEALKKNKRFGQVYRIPPRCGSRFDHRARKYTFSKKNYKSRAKLKKR